MPRSRQFGLLSCLLVGLVGCMPSAAVPQSASDEFAEIPGVSMPANASTVAALPDEPQAVVVSHYDGMVFSGGKLHFSLEQTGQTVTQYVANSYDTAVMLDFSVTYAGVEPTFEAKSQVVPAKSRVVLARFQRTDADTFHVDSQFHAVFGDPQVQPVDYTYALPFLPPDQFPVIQGFNGGFSHQEGNQYAIDLGMPEGSRIAAARDGVVVAFNDTATQGGPDPALMALEHVNWILIRHDDGTLGEYAHLQPQGVKVAIGQRVRRGETIGVSGNTGYTSAPHLHFSVFSAASGTDKRTFPFAWQVTPQEPAGQAPLEGLTYKAF